MGIDKPHVSIGLPVFNGENYLAEAIDSILAQTFSGFELIISDNASTDKTQEICEMYAAQDHRIRYYRNEKNIGAARNFNRVFELSLGEYFKWIAHDDLIAPDLLLKCVEVLDQYPDVVLCNSKVKVINEDEQAMEDYNIRLANDMRLNNINSPKPQDRFGDLIMLHHPCFDIFGLIRTSALKMTSLIAGYIGSDRVLLVELGLLGRFYEIPEYLLFPRDHPERSTRTLLLHERATWFDPANKGRIVLPHWSTFIESFKAIRHVSLSWSERIGCYLYMGKWLRLYGKYLLKDVLVATNLAPY